MSSTSSTPTTGSSRLTISRKLKIIVLLACIMPFFANADGIKFNIKNTTKNVVTVFYKIDKKSGVYKLRSLVKLAPGEQKLKEESISKGDTIEFYGQDAQDQTSV